MAFTDVWDNTQPPDTQAANLLGQDIRNLKLDIQQRVAALSGTDAAKAGFNFEAGFVGVLYFATDTGKIYRWSGAAWVDVTTNFISFTSTSLTDYNNFSAIAAVNPGGAQDLQTVAIPGNAIQLNSFYEIYAVCSITAYSAGSVSLSVFIGSTRVAQRSGLTANGIVIFKLACYCPIADDTGGTGEILYGSLNALGVASSVFQNNFGGGNSPFAAGFTIKTTVDGAVTSTVSSSLLHVRIRK